MRTFKGDMRTIKIIVMWLILICSTHPSLRNMVANLSFLAHVVPWNYKCPLNIENWLFQTSFDLQEAHYKQPILLQFLCMRSCQSSLWSSVCLLTSMWYDGRIGSIPCSWINSIPASVLSATIMFHLTLSQGPWPWKSIHFMTALTFWQDWSDQGSWSWVGLSL